MDSRLLDYNQSVRSIFPEFCQEDKEEDVGTIADLMKHELGLPILSKTIQREDMLVKNIKNNSMGKLLEGEQLAFKSGSMREYHMLTRGFIANEIVRRVDPKGRTIGELIKHHLSEPLDADAYLGLGPKEMKRAVNVEYLKSSQVLVPLGFLWQNLFDLGGMSKNLFFEMFSGKSLPVPPIEGFSWLNLDSIFSFFNSEMGRTVEIPSININCSARGI